MFVWRTSAIVTVDFNGPWLWWNGTYNHIRSSGLSDLSSVSSISVQTVKVQADGRTVCRHWVDKCVLRIGRATVVDEDCRSRDVEHDFDVWRRAAPGSDRAAGRRSQRDTRAPRNRRPHPTGS